MDYLKVSIIIATYNTEKYIEECLDSIFSQTLKEMEVILIDDGSTDNTVEVVKKYNKYSNFVYYYQENKGAGSARNYGVHISKGEYIMFMDPDDKYPVNDCVEMLYNTAAKNGVNICGGNILYNDKGVISNCYSAGEGDSNNSKNKILKIKDYYYLYGHTRYIFKNSLIKSGNVSFAYYKRYQDQVFTVKAMGLAGEIYELDYPVYEYRINHKTLNLDLTLLIEILKGFRDTLKLICDYDLRLMFEHNYYSFIESRMKMLCKYAFRGNEELDGVIYDINQIVKCSGWCEESQLTVKWVKKTISDDAKVRAYLENVFDSGKPFIIYGAGNNTQKLVTEYHERLQNLVGIAVTDSDYSVKEVEEFQVKKVEEYIPLEDDTFFLITPGINYKDEIIDNLKRLQISNYLWIDMAKIVY